MNKLAVKDSKEQLMAAFQQIVVERKNLESKLATKQAEAEKEKTDKLLKLRLHTQLMALLRV